MYACAALKPKLRARRSKPPRSLSIILDLNGTLSVGSVVPVGVKPRLDKLKEFGFTVLFFTGNTRNDADGLAADLGIK